MKITCLPFLLVLIILVNACQHNKVPSQASSGLPGDSMIRGRVTDEGGSVIAGVVVRLEGPALSGIREVTTDSRGFYAIPEIPPGKDYTMTLIAWGFTPLIRRKIEVQPFSTLTLEYIESENRIEIWAPVVPIDYTKAGGSTTFQFDPTSGEMKPHF